MLFMQVIVYSENHTKPIDTLCGQKTELLNVKQVAHFFTKMLSYFERRPSIWNRFSLFLVQ
jgi:hypothetical protein